MQRIDRSGFTLVEVLVALVVGALVLASARGLLEALGTHTRALVAASRANDARANNDALLRQTLADLFVRNDTLPSLEGDEQAVTFLSDCDVANGWPEPCDVRISIEPRAGTFRVTIRLDGEEAGVIRDSLSIAGLRYLRSTETGGVWTNRWQNTVMLPQAIGILADDDTIVARVGGAR